MQYPGRKLTDFTDGTKLPSPKGTLKSRSSKSLLRFGRSNKRASSESKAAGPVPVGEVSRPVLLCMRWDKSIPSLDVLSVLTFN